MNKDMQQIKCPKCSVNNKLKSVDSVCFTCHFCHSLIDVKSSTIISEGTVKSFVALSNLRLGQKATINGVSIELIGCIRLSESDEDGVWYWEEWLAKSKDELYWLEFDQYNEHFIFFEELDVLPSVEINSLTVDFSLEVEPGKSIEIKEIGKGTIVAFVGEFPFIPKKDVVINYADNNGKNTIYSVEWTSEYIELFKGEVFSSEEINNLFNVATTTSTFIVKKKPLPKNQRRITTIALFIFGILSAVIGAYYMTNGGKLIYTNDIVLCDPRIEERFCAQEQLPIGPISLTETNRVYKIRVISNTTTPVNWNFVTIHLLDETLAPQLGFDADFYEEAWSDGGESGVEIVDKVDKRFRLTKAGNYYIDIETEKQILNNSTDVYTIQVFSNSANHEYFFIFAGIILFMWILRIDKK